MKTMMREYGAGDLPVLQEIRKAAFEPVFRSFREIVGPDIAAIAFARADEEQAKLLDDICAATSNHQVKVAVIGERPSASCRSPSTRRPVSARSA